MTEWAKAVIDSKKVMAVPIMTHPGIEMIGRRVIDAVSDGEVHFNAVRALAGRYDTAAATVIMDLTVEAEAFGADIAFEPDEVPAVRGPHAQQRRRHSPSAGAVAQRRPRAGISQGQPACRPCHNRPPRAGRMYRTFLACRPSLRHVGDYDSDISEPRGCRHAARQVYRLHPEILHRAEEDGRQRRCHG